MEREGLLRPDLTLYTERPVNSTEVVLFIESADVILSFGDFLCAALPPHAVEGSSDAGVIFCAFLFNSLSLRFRALLPASKPR